MRIDPLRAESGTGCLTRRAHPQRVHMRRVDVPMDDLSTRVVPIGSVLLTTRSRKERRVHIGKHARRPQQWWHNVGHEPRRDPLCARHAYAAWGDAGVYGSSCRVRSVAAAGARGGADHGTRSTGICSRCYQHRILHVYWCRMKESDEGCMYC